MAECEVIIALAALVFDRWDTFEKVGHVRGPLERNKPRGSAHVYR